MRWLFARGAEAWQRKVAVAVCNLPKRKSDVTMQGGSVTRIVSATQVGALCPVNGLLSFAATSSTDDGTRHRPYFCARISTLGVDLSKLVKAVTAGRLAYGAEPILGARHPLLRQVIAIEDTPDDPFMVEGLVDVAHEWLHDYVMAVSVGKTQSLLLYSGASNSPVATVRVAVNDRVREGCLDAFLKVAKAYGPSLRSKTDFDVAASEYQATHRISMPRHAVKLELAT